ncbi:hypothetical protein HGB24_03775 [Candidatus Saccharibacteria bacterium]|nr:hypothetical protein [Candidatus Saccharibacteria bacterium]
MIRRNMFLTEEQKNRVRHDCLTRAVWASWPSDFDSPKDAIKEYEQQCIALEKERGLYMSIIAITVQIVYDEYDEERVDGPRLDAFRKSRDEKIQRVAESVTKLFDRSLSRFEQQNAKLAD